MCLVFLLKVSRTCTSTFNIGTTSCGGIKPNTSLRFFGTPSRTSCALHFFLTPLVAATHAYMSFSFEHQAECVVRLSMHAHALYSWPNKILIVLYGHGATSLKSTLGKLLYTFTQTQNKIPKKPSKKSKQIC